MANITPPKYVRHILVTLRSHGHLAYLVGGCVRDMILGVRPNDWDICTSALPDEVMAIFPHSRPTGIKHGTVTVVTSSRSVEVTTFRSEGRYLDHRRPESVSFVGDLTADLSRRDFTMNAIALPPDGLIADPFGGVQDIKNRVIRCVGDPDVRFEEDALRMLRALRFSARLGFEIEENTLAAIRRNAHLAGELAAERVRDEIERILLSGDPGMLCDAMDCGLLDRYLLKRECSREKLDRIASLPRKALDRWALLCVILCAHGCIRSVSELLTALRLDSRTLRCCEGAYEIFSVGKPSDRVEWKKLFSRCGTDCVMCASACFDALCGGGAVREVKAILKSGECFSMKHLAVNGDDLLSLGVSGRELGDMLRFLLDYVMEHPESNDREILMSLISGTDEN